MKQLLQKIIETGGAKIYAVLLGIITLAISARWLGPEGRGIYAAVTTWVILFTDLTHLSLGTALIHRATNEREQGWLSSVMGNLFSFTVVVTLFSWSIALLIYYAGQWGLPTLFNDLPWWALLIGFIAMPFGIWDSYTQTLLNIEDKLRYYNKVQIAGSTSNTLLVILLVVVQGLGVAGALFAKLFWASLVAIGGIHKLLFITKERATGGIRTVSTNMGELKSLVTNGLKLHVGILGTLMLVHIDIIMVNSYLGNVQTGIYQLAVQVVSMMLIVSYASMTVLQGEATKLGAYRLWAKQKKILMMVFAFIVVACFIAAVTADWWLILLAGQEFAASVPIFRMLVFVVMEQTVTNILSVQFVARGWFWQLSAINISKGILNVVLNMILIPKYGIEGAVYGTLIVSACVFTLNIFLFFYFDRNVKKHLASEATQQQL